MTAYIVNIFHSFFPLALLSGLLNALWAPFTGRKAVRDAWLAAAAGIAAGSIIYFTAFKIERTVDAQTYLLISGIVLSFLTVCTGFLPAAMKGRILHLGWVSSLLFILNLAAAGIFAFLSFSTVQSPSAVDVLNTEAIINAGAFITGFSFIAFLAVLTSKLGSNAGRKIILGLFVLTAVLLSFRWTAEVMLGLIKMEMMELTGKRVSFIAKITDLLPLFTYIQIIIPAILSFCYFKKKDAGKSPIILELSGAEKRKEKKMALARLRLLKSAAVLITISLLILLYHDLYASRPPKISAPVRLMPDESGVIKIKTDEVKSGKLNRFSYVTGDGHVVRFFLLNRYKDRVSIGVVYDACMICGDMGYIQKGNEVICLACNVRIFTPSIGKPGGCNPIPLKHDVEGEHIVIKAEELDKGASYFSEVIPIDVKDPVTGKKMKSTDAPFRYDYGGRTYYFESKESLEKFKNSPEEYTGRLQARYFRVQGYR